MNDKKLKMSGKYSSIMEHRYLQDDERLPEAQFRCMLDNIRREDFVYAESTAQHGTVKQIIRNIEGIPVCLGILNKGGNLDFVSVDRISRWTYKGPRPNEWVDPSRYTHDYEDEAFTYEDYCKSCYDIFYDYEMPRSWEWWKDNPEVSPDAEEWEYITFSIHEKWEDMFWEGKEDKLWEDELWGDDKEDTEE